jgi:rhodanese-related sulfurtransferase
MGNTHSVKKISFKDMQKIIKDNKFTIINTLNNDNQSCLIINTLAPNEVINLLNNFLKNNKDQPIVIYGKHCIDESLIKKYTQLLNLGFKNIHVYVGGLFEWLTLQDIYGVDEFPTTSIEHDILRFSP